MKFTDLLYAYNTAILSGNKRKAKKLAVKVIRACMVHISAHLIQKAKKLAVKKTMQFR